MNNLFTNFLPILKNTGSTVLIRGLFGLARIVILLLIARMFGPEEFGRLSLVLSITEIFKVMADAGLDIITIRRFTIHRRLSSRIMNNALAAKLAAATAGYVIAAATCWALYRDSAGLVLQLIIGVSIYTSLLINSFVSYFQARLTISNIIKSNIASVLTYAALTVLGLQYHLSLKMFAAMIPVAEMVNLLLTSRVYRRFHSIRLRFDRKIIASLLKESIPSGISGLIVVIYLRLDNLMIGGFIGEHGVGEYAVAYRLTEPFLLIFSSLSLSLYASLSVFRSSDGIERAKRSLASVMVPIVGVSFVIAFLLSTFAGPLIGMFSEAYSASSGVLAILSWAIFFKAVNPQLTAFINSRGKYALMIIISGFNLVVTVVSNLILLPRYGIRGAAGAVVISEGMNMIVQTICVLILARTVQAHPANGTVS